MEKGCLNAYLTALEVVDDDGHSYVLCPNKDNMCPKKFYFSDFSQVSGGSKKFFEQVEK